MCGRYASFQDEPRLTVEFGQRLAIQFDQFPIPFRNPALGELGQNIAIRQRTGNT
jgi:hypothetical protein